MSLIAWFEELHKSDTEIAGGKGANLGELASGGFPVPEGFVVTADAYLAAMDAAGVRADLKDASSTVDADDAAMVADTCRHLREMVREAPVPDFVRDAILASYHRLGDDMLVAVRSSATAEDAAGASFAGMNETFTNVSGDEPARALSGLLGVALRRAGPRLPRHPGDHRRAGDRRRRAADGRRRCAPASCSPPTRRPATATGSSSRPRSGRARSSSAVRSSPTPTSSPRTAPRSVEVRIGDQDPQDRPRRATGDERDPADRGGGSRAGARRRRRSLALARLGLRVEDALRRAAGHRVGHRGRRPLFLVQSRPITTLGAATGGASRIGAEPTPLSRAWRAAPGIAAGRVRVLSSPAEGAQLLRPARCSSRR